MDNEESIAEKPNEENTAGYGKAGLVVVKWLSILLPILALGLVLIVIFFAIISSTQDSCFVDDATSGQAVQGVGGSWENTSSQAHKDMQYAADQFKKLGMSGDNIAAALAEGNRESNFNPKAINPAGSVKGIWQWGAGGINGNRYGNTADTTEAQVALAIKELTGPYKITLVSMQGADIEHSVTAWATHFEGLPVDDAAQRKHSQTVATAQKIKQVFNLNFSGSINLKEPMQGNNNAANTGASNTMADCNTDTNGTASGLPVQGKYNITGGYPDYAGHSGAAHYGVDFQTVNHDGEAGNVYSVADGTVVSKASDPVGGNFVVIKTVDGKYTYFGHAPSQSAIVVNVGDKVKKGQHISHQGQTGMATGVHVHFGVNTSQRNFAPHAPGVISPGKYLTKIPKQSMPDQDTVIPIGVYNAK